MKVNTDESAGPVPGTDASCRRRPDLWKNDCGTIRFEQGQQARRHRHDRDISSPWAFGRSGHGDPRPDVMSKKVYACSPDEDTSAAPNSAEEVRRLPVTTPAGGSSVSSRWTRGSPRQDDLQRR